MCLLRRLLVGSDVEVLLSLPFFLLLKVRWSNSRSLRAILFFLSNRNTLTARDFCVSFLGLLYFFFTLSPFWLSLPCAAAVNFFYLASLSMLILTAIFFCSFVDDDDFDSAPWEKSRKQDAFIWAGPLKSNDQPTGSRRHKGTKEAWFNFDPALMQPINQSTEATHLTVTGNLYRQRLALNPVRRWHL